MNAPLARHDDNLFGDILGGDELLALPIKPEDRQITLPEDKPDVPEEFYSYLRGGIEAPAVLAARYEGKEREHREAMEKLVAEYRERAQRPIVGPMTKEEYERWQKATLDLVDQSMAGKTDENFKKAA